MTRAADADALDDVGRAPPIVACPRGPSNADTIWLCTTDKPRGRRG
jgi:hypothetical protein